jgi:hypothetical protein
MPGRNPDEGQMRRKYQVVILATDWQLAKNYQGGRKAHVGQSSSPAR